MIYSQTRYYVCCDKCGKTIETNAADEYIAARTVEMKGWKSAKAPASHPQAYINLCPKCKVEGYDSLPQQTKKEFFKVYFDRDINEK